jgi:hypothetical protein
MDCGTVARFRKSASLGTARQGVAGRDGPGREGPGRNDPFQAGPSKCYLHEWSRQRTVGLRPHGAGILKPTRTVEQNYISQSRGLARNLAGVVSVGMAPLIG